MTDRIIRDPRATETVDVGRLEIEYGLRVAERILDAKKATKKDKDLARRQIKTAQAMLEKYTPPTDAPTITIGFVPHTKSQYLLARVGELKIKGKKKPTAEDVEADLGYAREWLRWGIRSHDNMGLAYETETVVYQGRKHEVPTDDMLEFYGHLGIIHALHDRILRWTMLGGKKKTRSSPTSGAGRGTSTARPAAETPA